MKVRFLDELEVVMKKCGLKNEDFCIVASAVLAYEGIRENHDLDIVLKPEVREEFLKRYKEEVEVLPGGTINITGQIQAACNKYKGIGIGDGDLFCEKYAVRRGDYLTVKPEVELVQKIKRRRRKDQMDLRYIGFYFFEHPGFDMELFRELVMGQELLTRVSESVTERLDMSETTVRLEGSYVMPIGSLLHRGYGTEGYERYDILVLAYILSSGYREAGIDQRKILLAEKWLKKKNYRQFSEVEIDKTGLPEYESIELCQAICRHDSYVKVRIGKGNENKNYSCSWVKEYCGSLTKEIENYKTRIFKEYGVYFCAVIWGAAITYVTDIVERIGEKFQIISREKLEFEEDEYDKFIKEIYEIDDVEPWKTAIKIGQLKQYEYSVEAILFEIPFPNFREKKRDGSYLSDEGAKLKRVIREEFRRSIPEYEKDVIIHIGDNHMHNAEMIKVIEKYGR